MHTLVLSYFAQVAARTGRLAVVGALATAALLQPVCSTAEPDVRVEAIGPGIGGGGPEVCRNCNLMVHVRIRLGNIDIKDLSWPVTTDSLGRATFTANRVFEGVAPSPLVHIWYVDRIVNGQTFRVNEFTHTPSASVSTQPFLGQQVTVIHYNGLLAFDPFDFKPIGG